MYDVLESVAVNSQSLWPAVPLLNPADPDGLADPPDPDGLASPANPDVPVGLHALTLMTAAITPMASGAASFLGDATIHSRF